MTPNRISNMEEPINKQAEWEKTVNLVIEQAKRLDPTLNDKDFREWFSSKQYVGKPFDSNLIMIHYRLYKNRLLKNKDSIVVVCGYEGEGKSTLAINSCSLIDSSFTEKETCFKTKRFFQILKKAQKGSSILIDEGGTMLFSREAMKRDNIMINKIFMIIRNKNLHIVICIPDFFSLDTYIREHRCNLLLYIPDRGDYKGITRKGIRYMNTIARKNRNIDSIKLMTDTFWHGHFNKDTPSNFNYEEYLKMKDEYCDQILSDALHEETEIDSLVPKLIPSFKVQKQFNYKDTTKWLKMLRTNNINPIWFANKWNLTPEDVYNIDIIAKKGYGSGYTGHSQDII
jgi:hypothetical protein